MADALIDCCPLPDLLSVAPEFKVCDFNTEIIRDIDIQPELLLLNDRFHVIIRATFILRLNVAVALASRIQVCTGILKQRGNAAAGKAVKGIQRLGVIG